MPSCCGWCEECVVAVLVEEEAGGSEKWEVAVGSEREKWKLVLSGVWSGVDHQESTAWINGL